MFLECLADSFIDVLKLLPFLFIAFLIIELIEHKLSNKSQNIISKSGKFGPLIGSLFGLFPQCGFSVMATNLYVTRIISLGTLIAIYLTTSDEMLPILLSEKVNYKSIILILAIKFIIGLIAGFVIDLFCQKTHKKLDYNICHDEKCNCDKENLFLSALKHTLKTIVFIFIVTLVLNLILEYFGQDYLAKLFLKNSIFSPFIASLIGLIPNCGASVMLTELYLKGSLSLSSAIGGLLTGCGVALLVLFKTNKNKKENLKILLLIYFIGAISGVIIDLISKAL